MYSLVGMCETCRERQTHPNTCYAVGPVQHAATITQYAWACKVYFHTLPRGDIGSVRQL